MRSNEFELYYQAIAPVVSEKDYRNCEILLRLPDPKHGLILPGLFLPAVERYDLMPSVDRWVVEHVVDWLETHRDEICCLNLCAINLSPRTLLDPTFPGHLKALLAASSDICKRLSFEITAQAALADISKTMTFMSGLKQLGCAVSLVGVGIGTPAFTQLRQLPVDFVKLDESAATAVTRSPLDEKLVTSTNEIAHLLGQKTIVEFVEDQATVDLLARIGVDYLQGRWIAPPRKLAQLFTQPIEEFRIQHA
jgi:EAL domain-containing protein (putative c-di-GMP-specific phosphodiesterase class I)